MLVLIMASVGLEEGYVLIHLCEVLWENIWNANVADADGAPRVGGSQSFDSFVWICNDVDAANDGVVGLISW